MKKPLAIVLTVVLLLCGAAFAEEESAMPGTEIRCEIVDGSYVIHIPVKEGDEGWKAGDLARDDAVVKLGSAELADGEYGVRYDPVGDGKATVAVRHYDGIACDQVHTFDLLVKDGAVQECTGGSATARPDAAEIDAWLSGEWLEQQTQFTRMTAARNGENAWDVEIASPMTHGAYIFRATISYDCEREGLVYADGRFWEVPITDSAEEVELGEAKVSGTSGIFTCTGDSGNLCLDWADSGTPDQHVVFCPADAGADGVFEPAAATDGAADSDLYTEDDMEAAKALIAAEFDTWEGCVLHSLRYAGDACDSEENIAWMNSLRDGKEYVQCIEFLSDFHSPAEGDDALEADTEYTDFQWWLAREEGGDWELLTWGY